MAAAARWWQAYASHDFAFALIETLQAGCSPGRAACAGGRHSRGEIYDGLERAAPAYVLGRRTGELAIFGHGPSYLRRLMVRAHAVASEQYRYGSRAGLEHAVIDGLLALAVLTTALVGVWLLTEGRLEPALFPLVIVLAGGALVPVIEVTQTARRLGEIKAGAARIFTILNQKPQVADRGHAARPAACHAAWLGHCRAAGCSSLQRDHCRQHPPWPAGGNAG